MVYVFGLNVPLLEILLIFLILLAVGLALIWVELKRLRDLLMEERSVVHQFEKDLVRFEADEGKTHNNQLESYIKSALGRGASPDEIEKVLKGRGWSKDVIEKVLNSVVEEGSAKSGADSDKKA